MGGFQESRKQKGITGKTTDLHGDRLVRRIDRVPVRRPVGLTRVLRVELPGNGGP